MRHPTLEIILSGVSADGHLSVFPLRDMFDHARAPPSPSAALLWSAWLYLTTPTGRRLRLELQD